MFSSSLLYGNFLTMDQRRLIAMRVVEEGNRWVVGGVVRCIMFQGANGLEIRSLTTSSDLRRPSGSR